MACSPTTVKTACDRWRAADDAARGDFSCLVARKPLPRDLPQNSKHARLVSSRRRATVAYLRRARKNIPSAIRTKSRKTSSTGPRLKGI
jgi:hypothetical protein